MMRSRSQTALALLLIAGVALSVRMAQADPPDVMPDPEQPPAQLETVPQPEPPSLAGHVQRLLDAEYLTDEEAAQLRVFHGVWRDEDLEDPALRAQAALIAGALNDPALTDDRADPLDRAEGMVRRGELEDALSLLDGQNTVRAARLRADALFHLGRHNDAADEVETLFHELERRALDAPELTEAARALDVRARIRGADRAVAADFRALMAMYTRAHDELDRLYWPALVAEAQLLYEKHNRGEAAQAAQSALRLNPAASDAWAILAQLGVDGFDPGRVSMVRDEMDRVARTLHDDAVSIDGALATARIMLRQSDPESAEEALAPVLDRFPTHREALALRAAAAAAAFDEARSHRLLEEFDALSPGSPLALYTVGAVLSEARQYDEAAAMLERAVDRLPHWPVPIVELGLLEMQSGRDDHALRALERAFRLDPFNARADNSLRLIRELVSYDTVENDHFIVRYRPGMDALLAREMLPVLDRIHERVAGDGPGGINFEPDRKTVIELMPDHRWFSVRITGMTRIHTMAAATGPVIAMESPRVGPRHRVGHYDWPRVLQHEYGHTVTLARTRNRIPHWFTEAASVFLEDRPRDFQSWQLLARAYDTDQLFDLEQVNRAFVRPERPTDRAQAYAQSHWMYQFIVERWGDRAPLELMDRYADGEREASAFRRVLGVEADTFLDEFRTWARGDLERVGMRRPEGTPSIRELLEAEADEDDPRPSPTIEMVKHWLNEHPDHADAIELLIELKREAAGGEVTSELIPLLERYAEARPVDPMPHRHLVRLYLDRGGTAYDPEAAIGHLTFLDDRAQNTAAYAVQLALAHIDAGRYEEAYNSAVRATRIAPFVADHRELAARIALQRRDLRAAEQHIRALTEIEPDRPRHEQRLDAVRRMLEQADTQG